MVSTIIVAVAGTLLGSLVGGGFGIYQTKLQQQAEDKRRHAEMYSDKKVDTLESLYNQMAKAHSILIPFVPPENQQETTQELDINKEQVEEVNRLTREIRELIIMSQIFLDDPDKKHKLMIALMSMNHALGRVGKEHMANPNAQEEMLKRAEISAEQIDEDVDLNQYYDIFYEAMEVLRTELYEPISRLE